MAAKSKIHPIFLIAGLIGVFLAFLYFGGEMYRGRVLMRVGIHVINSTVILTNNNEAVWVEGRARLDDEELGFVVDFVNIAPGETIEIPFSESNEFKNAKSLRQLPVKVIWIEVKGYQDRELNVVNIIIPKK